MAAGLPVPKTIVAHGWLLFEESKMSKSRGNIVRTETILDVLGADALRYFLLRESRVWAGRILFVRCCLVQRYNSDLANGLGNLASRTLTMINRYFKGEVPYPSHAASKTAADDAIANAARNTIREFGTLFDQFQFSRALEVAWALIASVDKYIVENEPWALGEKKDEDSRSRPGDGAVHRGRSAADRDGAGVSSDAGCHGKDLGAAGIGRYQEAGPGRNSPGDNCLWAQSWARCKPVFPARR